MFILIIDDKEETIRGIKDEFEMRGDRVDLCDFTNCQDRIKRTDIDLIIADWKDDDTNDNKGEEVLECIYNAFVPTIIFSAMAPILEETINQKRKNNPFIELISKGDEEPVIKKIVEWEKSIELFRYIKKNMNSALLSAIALLAPDISKDIDKNVLSYYLNRRAANYLLENSVDGEITEDIEKLTPAWMEYDYPATSKTLLVADILAKERGDNRDYYVVLTPSCDMARLDETKSKNRQVVVAKCIDDKAILSGLTIPNTNEAKKKKDSFIENASKKFREACLGLIALPEMPKIMPRLTVNFKDLDLLTHYEIALSEDEFNKNKDRYKYFRVASIESPYREQIVWGYMTCACRPGVPERDYKKWAEGFINDSN